jgi:hypothetical protein
MRARHRRFIAVLTAAIAVALSVVAPASSGAAVAEGHNCPQGTSWDNKLQRCV